MSQNTPLGDGPMLSQEVHEQQKLKLMFGAVDAVVRDGLSNATARSIGNLSGINEVYIYRYFENMDDLFAKTFDLVDDYFLNFIIDNFPVIGYADIDYKDRCRILFNKCWHLMLDNPNWLIFYIRYYYSNLFQKNSYDSHMARYTVLNDMVRPACYPGTDPAVVLHHVLNTTLGQARKQTLHPIDSATAEENAFWLVYSVLKCGKGI